MVSKIEQLTIEGFRGASQPFTLDFDKNKPVTLIFGENGTGKSTLVDAIEWVARGSTSFTDNWKLGQRKASFIPTIGRSPNEVSLSIQYDGKQLEANLANAIQNIPSVHVLRRRLLQDYIEADQAERYRVVGEFMDIPAIESAEASLRQACKDRSKAVESATTAITQAEESLTSQWEAAGSPGLGDQYAGAEAWARDEAAADPETLEEVYKQATNNISIIEKLNRAAEKVLAGRADLKQAQQAAKEAEQALEKVEKAAHQGSAGLATLLQEAKDYLAETPEQLCPVCEETEIDAPQLVQKLSKRLEEMAALAQANRAVQDATRNLQAKEMLYQQATDELIAAAQSALGRFGQELKHADEFKQSKEAENGTNKTVDIAQAINQELSAKLTGFREEAQATQKKLHTLNSIRKHVQTLDDKKSELKALSRLYKALTQAVEVYQSRRQAYIKGVLEEIEKSVDVLYQQIHPEEDIGNLKLKIDEKKRASLDYKVKFQGREEVHPQPYYSDSHLDTLGLCIFLALAKRSSGENAIIILDDVLGSVDQPHLHRTMDMLIAESNGFAQIIITTHYRPLRDRFRYANHPGAPVQMLELKPWALDFGIRVGLTVQYRDELRQKINAGDFERESVASQAGNLFENLLEFISRKYVCKVPHLSEMRFTFGDLANAPNKKLRAALNISIPDGEERKEIPLKPIYDRLGEAINIRNLVGCHFNQWAGELADDDVKDMATLALELADTLICEKCGGLPSSKKSGSYWECSCKYTRMNPLQQPK